MTVKNPSSDQEVLTLADVSAGWSARVLGFAPGAECADRLREMGLSENAEIKRLNGKDPIICRVRGARIALSLDLARAIAVDTLTRES